MSKLLFVGRRVRAFASHLPGMNGQAAVCSYADGQDFVPGSGGSVAALHGRSTRLEPCPHL